jgi:two-component sensor histidine kinase
VIQGGLGSSKVHKLVKQMLAVHDDPLAPRFDVNGPDLKIGSRPSLSLSLILHELATNAVKHGALSVPDGRVRIDWSVVGADSRKFEFVWSEHGGPPVRIPKTLGSGSRLVKAGIAGAADSVVDIVYDEAGLRCVVSAELTSFQQEH